MAPPNLIIHLPLFLFLLCLTFFSLPFLLPTCILHPSRTQVFMIIGTGTQDTKHVQCNRTIPLTVVP
jgi:hypothetical protein